MIKIMILPIEKEKIVKKEKITKKGNIKQKHSKEGKIAEESEEEISDKLKTTFVKKIQKVVEKETKSSLKIKNNQKFF